MKKQIYGRSIFIALFASFLIVIFSCDDKSVVSTIKNLSSDDGRVTVRIRKNTHQSDNLTMNVQVNGLAASDVIDPKLSASESINVFSVEEQEFFPQDTVFFMQYGDQAESTFEAQIRYNTEADSGLFILELNGEQVIDDYIYLFGGPLIKETVVENTVDR